ncbi:flagellar protein FliO/FliZ [Quadrisphaera granulorum]|uniref:Flagellar protein n=1 Tax=Quadrisphaera granulorum TaxID=317664 RepID=A0A316A6H8_9ACTN|nr:flagellar biosynthetic protein FliO [Quadrisphaera granulorum]PWJ52580.1 flagellar protein FliO/FliZ [Quadrisphaera granulorum]SZE97630.1 flagellar protein FliO/FliZ [Quadrisphaera granulorum]
MDLAVTALRVAASLAAVLCIMWLLYRTMRRRGAGAGLDSGRFAVVGRQSLGRSSGVTVLRVGDEALVLGVTEQSVQLLARTPLSAVSEPVRIADAVPAPRLGGEDDGDALAGASAVGESLWGRRRVVASTTAGSRKTSSSLLAGTALSPATWTQALDVIRERTTRR